MKKVQVAAFALVFIGGSIGVFLGGTLCLRPLHEEDRGWDIVGHLLESLPGLGLNGGHYYRISRGRDRMCIEYLYKLNGAKSSWALEAKAKTTDTPVATDLANADGTGWLPKFPVCPAGGTYTIGNLLTTPTCSVDEHEL